MNNIDKNVLVNIQHVLLLVTTTIPYQTHRCDWWPDDTIIGVIHRVEEWLKNVRLIQIRPQTDSPFCELHVDPFCFTGAQKCAYKWKQLLKIICVPPHALNYFRNLILVWVTHNYLQCVIF